MYILAAENSWASVGHNNLQERKRERERFKRYLIEFVDGWKRLWTWEKLYIRHTHGFVWIMKTVCEWERFWVWRTFWVWLGEKFIHMCVNWEREREREEHLSIFSKLDIDTYAQQQQYFAIRFVKHNGENGIQNWKLSSSPHNQTFNESFSATSVPRADHIKYYIVVVWSLLTWLPNRTVIIQYLPSRKYKRENYLAACQEETKAGDSFGLTIPASFCFRFVKILINLER